MASSSRDFKCTFTLSLPTEDLAVIMKSALEVDQDIAPHRLTKVFRVQENQLIVLLEACDVKMLRTGMSSLMDMMNAAKNKKDRNKCARSSATDSYLATEKLSMSRMWKKRIHEDREEGAEPSSSSKRPRQLQEKKSQVLSRAALLTETQEGDLSRARFQLLIAIPSIHVKTTLAAMCLRAR
eukprot:gene30318-36637_t